MTDVLAKCEICQALLDEEDLFCANCGTEAPRQQPTADLATRVFTHKFQCSNCGASMSYDASAGSLRCPFCSSVDLVEQADGKEIAPKKVVPFDVNQETAIAAMRQWLGKGFWRPSDLSEQALVVSTTAVYLPYWVFAGDTHTYWTADTNQTPSGARGDWFPLFGEHRGQYQGMLIGASGALSSQETGQLCPYELSRGIEPDAADLENVIVEQFTTARKYARPLARQGVEAMEAQACQTNYVPGTARNVKANVRITGLSSEPCLLPVWIMAYRYGDQVFRFLVNGQTGKAAGAAPLSWRKVGLAAGIAVILLLIIAIVAALSSRQ